MSVSIVIKIIKLVIQLASKLSVKIFYVQIKESMNLITLSYVLKTVT